jgi:hypothetical protein
LFRSKSCGDYFLHIDFKIANGKLRAIIIISFGFVPYVNLVSPRRFAALRLNAYDGVYRCA